VEKDAVDAIVCDGEQKRRDGSVLIVEDGCRLAVELVHLVRFWPVNQNASTT
jgi:hypothetical protein